MDDLGREIEDELAALVDLSKSTIDATICRAMRWQVRPDGSWPEKRGE
jgi:hypothetical protein